MWTSQSSRKIFYLINDNLVGFNGISWPYFFRITLDTVIADKPSTSEKKSRYHHKLESHHLPGRGKVT